MISVNVSDANEKNGWKDIPMAGALTEGGTALLVNTGDWRTMRPHFLADKCVHCMMCFPTCPDSAIPVKDGKRQDFDFMHCKGCGVCVKVCPAKAMTWEKEEKL
ncbi:MAG: 4Fe-4S dicluster domain-containing protein [Spirochaetes bacterium]|nr:4Fe-4S dicluster domain-containing protein [Spirochaetota bacterium]